MGELNETQRYFIDEHIEDYMHGQISRRELLRRVTLISGSAVLAGSIVSACGTPAPRITSTSPQMEAVLKTAGVPYVITIYPGVAHAFHNDTNATAYNAVQAQKAWVGTVEWFRKYLV